MKSDTARPVITDAPARERYEAHLDGELAGVLEYKVTRGADRPHPHRGVARARGQGHGLYGTTG